MNDRTVILKDMSKINEIKVTYFVMTEEEYLEEDINANSQMKKKYSRCSIFRNTYIYIYIINTPLRRS